MKKNTIIISFSFILLVAISSFTIHRISEVNYKKSENERITLATSITEKAITTRNYEDIENAKEHIEKVKTKEKKNELIKKIEELELDIKKETIKNAYHDRLNIIESNLNQTELDNIIGEINLIEYEEIKNELLARTPTIQEKINQEKRRQEQIAYYNKMLQIDATPVISTPPADAIVLERLNGAITAFTPYCSDGCEGYVASGKFVGNGDIYQYDHQYGMVRIVAGDPSYPFGTIVRIKNLGYFGGDIYAIVLDRGGAIGKNRRALFDLLFATEENANRFGVAYNIECEILRIGY